MIIKLSGMELVRLFFLWNTNFACIQICMLVCTADYEVVIFVKTQWNDGNAIDNRIFLMERPLSGLLVKCVALFVVVFSPLQTVHDQC